MAMRPIAGWGDSNMAALGGTSASKLTTVLGSRFGVAAFNGATSGDWSKHTAADMNALPALVSITGGTMPASGSVTCTVSNIGTDGNNGTGFSGTLLGIACTISLDAGVWTLTRTTAGTATAIPAGTPLQSTAGLAHRNGELVIIWVGKNDANLTAVIADTVDNIQACVDYLTGDFRYLVMGHFIDTAQTSGWSHDRVLELNAALASAHGPNFVDVSAYVASAQIWTDTGITPTSTDLTAQVNLVLPPSLAADYGHLNTAGNLAVAGYVGDYIDSLGWYDAGAVDRYVGGDAQAASSSGPSTTVTIPAAAAAGDIAYIAHPFNHNNGAQDTATPAGWDLEDTQTFSTSFRAKLYRRTLQAGDAGTTVTLTNNGLQRLAAALGVLTGVSGQDVVAARVENVSSPSTNAAPTANAHATDVQLAFWTERSGTPSTAVLAPAGFELKNSAFGAGSGATSAAVAAKLTEVPANDSLGGGLWDPDGSNSGVIMWVVGVKTVSGPTRGFEVLAEAAEENREARAEVLNGGNELRERIPVEMWRALQ